MLLRFIILPKPEKVRVRCRIRKGNSETNTNKKTGKYFDEYFAKSIDFYLLKQYYIICVVTHAEVSELADEQD